MNPTSLLPILRLPFCCLECFSIVLGLDYWIRKYWDWNCFISGMKDAILSIVQSSTFKTLSLKGIMVPTTFFLSIVHPTTLELHSLPLSDFAGKNSNSLTGPASKRIAPMASHTVIDRCVWNFRSRRREHVCGTRFPSSAYFSLIDDREVPTQLVFLPFMSHLRDFEIYIDIGSVSMYDLRISSFLIGWLCISLTSPATLEHLSSKFGFVVSVITTPVAQQFFARIYVTLRSEVIWTTLPLLQPVHGYKELTLTLNTSLFTIMMILRLTRMKSKNLSLMVSLYFARKVFCSSKLFCSKNDVAWIAIPFQHLDLWPGDQVFWSVGQESG